MNANDGLAKISPLQHGATFRESDSDAASEITWEDIYALLFQFQLRRNDRSFTSSVSGRLESAMILTFRLGTDGVARIIANHVQALRRKADDSTPSFDKVILACGDIDYDFWNPDTLGDMQVIIPELGIENCDITRNYYSPLEVGSEVYRALPAQILNRANYISSKLQQSIIENNVGLLVIENVNSLPYNICAALATVIVSERMNLPVLNVCHDFYWEHRQGTRKRLFVNEQVDQVFGLIKILCPWRSPLWTQVTTTQAAKQWLLDKNFPQQELGVLPYATQLPDEVEFSKWASSGAVEDLERELDVSEPNNCSTYTVPFQVRYEKSHEPNRKLKPFYIVLPVKISSGKRIPLAIRFIQNLLKTPDFQSFIRGERRVGIVCAGALYDVPDSKQHLKEISDAIRTVYTDETIPRDIRQEFYLMFPLGVPCVESGLGGLTMSNLYAQADLIVFTSTRETWGLPILEAAAFGIPMAVTPYERPYERIFQEVTDGLAIAEIQVDEVQNGLLPSTIVPWLIDATVRKAVAVHNRKVVSETWSQPVLRQKMSLLAGLAITTKRDKFSGGTSALSGQLNISDPLGLLDQLCERIESSWLEKKVPSVVAITGPALWGKSTLANLLVKRLWDRQILPSKGCVLSIDDFGLSSAEMKEKSLNFCPESIKIGALTNAVTKLREGKTVVIPKFLHGSCDRSSTLAWSDSLIVIEGMFSLWSRGMGSDKGLYEEFNRLIDLGIFIKTDLHMTLSASVTCDLGNGKNYMEAMGRFQDRQHQYEKYVLTTISSANCLINTGFAQEYRTLIRMDWIS